ncbi:class I SAM-dependent methyltransferase [Thermodesulfobacteriota bacterium]
MNKLESKHSCIMCNSHKLLLIRQIPSSDIVKAWINTFKHNIANSFHGIDKIYLFKCAQCHISFFSPNVHDSADSIYTVLEQRDWYYMEEKWEYTMALKDIKYSDNVLEIGCGKGAFLKKIKNKLGAYTLGIDMNNSAIIEAKKAGLLAEKKDLKNLTTEISHNFDVICCFQLLEHVADPKYFIEQCCLLLKPEGKLILGLPNANSFLKYQFNILDMPPHHFTRWSKNTLQKIPSFYPLILDKIKYEPLAKYHVNEFVSTYFSYYKSLHILNRILHSRLTRYFSYFLTLTKLHYFLTGHTMYCSFIKK